MHQTFLFFFKCFLCVLFLDKQGNADVESGTSTSDQNNLPDRIRFRAGVSVNLRKEIGIKVRYLLLKFKKRY